MSIMRGKVSIKTCSLFSRLKNITTNINSSALLLMVKEIRLVEFLKIPFLIQKKMFNKYLNNNNFFFF